MPPHTPYEKPSRSRSRIHSREPVEPPKICDATATAAASGLSSRSATWLPAVISAISLSLVSMRALVAGCDHS